MNKKKFKQWKDLVIRYSEDKQLRQGQVFMLALALADNDIYIKITRSNFDCFYNDDLCDMFVDSLIKELK